jgi:hypothetical protein
MCYAWKMYFGTMYMYKNIRQAWDRNLRIYNEDPGEYFDQVLSFLKTLNGKPEDERYFRWHVGGDVPDKTYLLGLLTVCKLTPWVKHTLYTKRYEWFASCVNAIPTNLNVCISGWPGVDIPPQAQEDFQTFWLYNPQDPDPRIPFGTMECPGSCPECRACWESSIRNILVVLH